MYHPDLDVNALTDNRMPQFLSVLADRNVALSNTNVAVEAISGISAAYSLGSVFLALCLAGIPIVGYIAMLLDVLFFIVMLAVTVMTHDGASSCTGQVETPIGDGPAKADNGFGKNGFGGDQGENATYAVHLGLACRLNTAAFVVSIIGALLYICSAGMQYVLIRRHKNSERQPYEVESGKQEKASNLRRLQFWRR